MKNSEEFFNNDFQKKIVTDCLEVINTPFSLLIYLAIKYDSLLEIYKPSPFRYNTSYEYLLDIQAYALVAKNLTFCSQKSLKEDAYNNFYKIESICKDTNNRMSFPGYRPNFVHVVRRNVLYLIGECPNLDLDDNSSYMGPGSTTTNKRRFVNQLDKLSRQQECTIGNLSFAKYICNNTCITVSEDLVTAGATFSTVPKSYKTLRHINVEPGLNMISQKVLGSALRNCLKKHGYDLDTRDRLNKSAAYIGSISGDYATVDLSNASDTISYRVVKELLPSQWFHYLNLARSHNVLVKQDTVKLEKFSSMGNGFTFELESVIFLAVLMALKNNRFLRWGKDNTLTGDISVFGDDMIIRTEDYADLVEMLTYFGFQINAEKSFSSGPFRESCGSDYWDGINVRPIYFKGSNDGNNPTSYYVVANSIRRVSLLLYGCAPELSKFNRIYRYITKLIPQQLRVFGPDGYGDVFLVSDKYPYVLRNQIRYILAYRVVMMKRHYTMYPRNVQLSYALLSGSSEGCPIKGFSSRYQKYKIYIG